MPCHWIMRVQSPNARNARLRNRRHWVSGTRWSFFPSCRQPGECQEGKSRRKTRNNATRCALVIGVMAFCPFGLSYAPHASAAKINNAPRIRSVAIASNSADMVFSFQRSRAQAPRTIARAQAPRRGRSARRSRSMLVARCVGVVRSGNPYRCGIHYFERCQGWLPALRFQNKLHRAGPRAVACLGQVNQAQARVGIVLD